MENVIYNKLTVSFNELTNRSIKESLINTVYSQLNINNFRYQLLDDNKLLEPLKKDSFYVTPHIIGVNCWIIFYQLNSTKYHFIINKKDLKMYVNQMNPNQYKIYNFIFNDSNTSDKLYPLTILDGKFINNGIDPNNLTFILMDVLVYGGKKYTNNKMIDSNPELSKITLFETLLPILNITSNMKFTFKLASIFKYDQLGDLIFNKIKNSKLKINGLIFLPEISGKIYIYINDTEFNHIKTNNISDIGQQYLALSIPAIPIHMSIQETQLDNQLINTFVVHKTSITDVYELYQYNIKEESKIYLNLNNNGRIGIACIPDIKTSHYCHFKSLNNEIFINKCIFNHKTNKWQPICD